MLKDCTNYYTIPDVPGYRPCQSIYIVQLISWKFPILAQSELESTTSNMTFVPGHQD